MEDEHGGTSADGTPLFYTIASLRPPKIPVTLNRRAQLQRESLNGDVSLLRAMQNTDLGGGNTGSINAERQKAKKELTRAHRSLESLCDRLWLRQNEMYSQLCRYHKLKREAARRVYKLKQEELRKNRSEFDRTQQKNRVAAIASIMSFTDYAEDEDPVHHDADFVQSEGLPEPSEASETPASPTSEAKSCPVVQSGHLDTILKPDDAESVRRRNAKLPPKFVRSVTEAAAGEKLYLPPIKERTEITVPRPESTSSKSTALSLFEQPKPAGIVVKDNQPRRDSVERKILEEPFTVYRMDKNGEFVPRENMPLAFHTQMPSNRVKYRRRKLLEKERQNLQVCLKRAEDFRPVLHSVNLKDGMNNSGRNDMASRRAKYEFIAWMPM